MHTNSSLETILTGSRLIETDPNRAISLIKEGLKYEPNTSEAWFNLGIAFHEIKSIEKAINSYRASLLCDKAPELKIKTNLAQDLLLSEKYKEGWEMYEDRLVQMKETFTIYSNMYGEPWKGGNETRKFEELLIVAEQGFGDTIQFCSLALFLQESGMNIRLFCPEALAPLLRTQSRIKNICLTIGGKTQGVLWVPLMSLLDYYQ